MQTIDINFGHLFIFLPENRVDSIPRQLDDSILRSNNSRHLSDILFGLGYWTKNDENIKFGSYMKDPGQNRTIVSPTISIVGTLYVINSFIKYLLHTAYEIESNQHFIHYHDKDFKPKDNDKYTRILTEDNGILFAIKDLTTGIEYYYGLFMYLEIPGLHKLKEFISNKIGYYPYLIPRESIFGFDKIIEEMIDAITRNNQNMQKE